VFTAILGFALDIYMEALWQKQDSCVGKCTIAFNDVENHLRLDVKICIKALMVII